MRPRVVVVSTMLALVGACAETPIEAVAVDPWHAVLALAPPDVRALWVVYGAAARTEVVAVTDEIDLAGHAQRSASGTWVLDHPADYVRCEGDTCAALASFDADTELYGVLRSPRGTRALVVHRGADGVVADVLDLALARRTGVLRADGWEARWSNRPLSWVGEDRILASWSAGTYLAQATLYDDTGDTLLALACDAISQSGDGSYLACWHPSGAPIATEDRNLSLFDLSQPPDALAMDVPPELRGTAGIHDVLWDASAVTVLLATDERDHVRPIVIPLGL